MASIARTTSAWAIGRPQTWRAACRQAHLCAGENGWAITALAELAAATGEDQYAGEARRAAKWVLQNRALPGGGFHHGDVDAGVYLGDSLAMARAFLALS